MVAGASPVGNTDNKKYYICIMKSLFNLSGIFDVPFLVFALIFGKKETYYSCANCQQDVKYPQPTCHHCKENLEWNPKLNWKK